MDNEISDQLVGIIKSRNWLKYLAILFAVITVFQGFVIVQDGTVGVKRTFGAIDPEEVQPGVHFLIPWVQDIHKVSIQLGNIDIKEASAASKDLQMVKTSVSLQHNLNPAMVAETLQEVGTLDQLDEALTVSAVNEALKAVSAQHTAEELVTQREKVKYDVIEGLKHYINETLEQRGITQGILISNVAITDFKFSHEFDLAVEEKVQAEQAALKAKENLKQRRTNAEAGKIEKTKAADGIAYQITQRATENAAAIEREAKALRENPDLTDLRFIEAWDGVPPSFAGSGANAPQILWQKKQAQ